MKWQLQSIGDDGVYVAGRDAATSDVQEQTVCTSNIAFRGFESNATLAPITLGYGMVEVYPSTGDRFYYTI